MNEKYASLFLFKIGYGEYGKPLRDKKERKLMNDLNPNCLKFNWVQI